MNFNNAYCIMRLHNCTHHCAALDNIVYLRFAMDGYDRCNILCRCIFLHINMPVIKLHTSMFDIDSHTSQYIMVLRYYTYHYACHNIVEARLNMDSHAAHCILWGCIIVPNNTLMIIFYNLRFDMKTITEVM